MKTIIRAACITGVLFLMAGTAWAGDDGPKKGKAGKGQAGNPEAMFKRLDANGDGKLSREEMGKLGGRIGQKAKDKGKAVQNRGEMLFDTMDTNRDGSVSLEEFKAMREKLSAGLKDRAKKRPPQLPRKK
jgi:hypothetical protein